MEITLFTIGFTQKSAREFFTRLQGASVKRVIDVRLRNHSQLAGFAKKEDLAYFLKEIADISYMHSLELAPTEEMLNGYKTGNGDWSVYERQFLALIGQRKIERTFHPESLQNACLLCSEHLPDFCHRRLVAEYLREKWRGVLIRHLV